MAGWKIAWMCSEGGNRWKLEGVGGVGMREGGDGGERFVGLRVG